MTRATAASTRSRMRAPFAARGWNFGKVGQASCLSLTQKNMETGATPVLQTTTPCSPPPRRFGKVKSSRSKGWADFI